MKSVHVMAERVQAEDTAERQPSFPKEVRTVRMQLASTEIVDWGPCRQHASAFQLQHLMIGRFHNLRLHRLCMLWA